MARPLKRGLDYFPFDINLFEDEKISAIAGEFGIKGEIVVVKLLCAIYRNGYYLEWSELNQALLLKQFHSQVSSELLAEIVKRLVRWGFFDKSLFNSSNILTSVGIQDRYFTAISRRKSKIVNYPFVLVNVDNNQVNVCNNPVQTELMFAESTQIKGNEIITPLYPPAVTGGGNEGGLSREVRGQSVSYSTVENVHIPDDGVKRNFKGLIHELEALKVSAGIASQIVYWSNYGEIDHEVWKLISQARGNRDIKLPGQFILARLKKNINNK